MKIIIHKCFYLVSSGYVLKKEEVNIANEKFTVLSLILNS